MVDVCLDPPTLHAYLTGKIPSDSVEAVESHLRECPRCQKLVAQHSPTSDWLFQAIRQYAAAGSGNQEPELTAALAAIAALPPPLTQDTIGQALGDTGRLIRDYQLRRKLGEGGMGAVYLALHTRLKKAVAIKLLKAERNQDAQAIARFSVEMEAVGKLDHPHIVRALDAGEEAGTHFLVMEYLAGIDVARIVRGLGRLSLPDACEIIRQAALGLAHAHENDVVHRDVKPSNLMLIPAGKVKVLDLGLAHFRPALNESAGLTGHNQILGTLLYLAPEQLKPGGKVDARSDVYSLGVTLWELLLGAVPLRRGLMAGPEAEDRAARPDVPDAVWQMVTRMTAQNREDRPASMLEVAEGLRPWTPGANLVALFEQVAGQISLADQPQSGLPSKLSPAGRGKPAAHPPSRGVSDEDIVPPPISRTPLPSQEVANSQIDAAGAPALQRFLAGPAGFWMPTSGLAALAAVLALLVVINWPSKEPASHVLTPATETGYVIIKLDDVNRGLLQQELQSGNLVAVNAQSGKRIPLQVDKTELPIGDYTLVCDAAEWRLHPLPFSVAFNVERTLTPTVDLRFPWKFPQIPSEAGSSCEYEGRLWYVDMGGSSRTASIPYLVKLSMLAQDESAPAALRRLKVEVRDQQNAYSETAYLLIDVPAWQEDRNLEITRGWLMADSRIIRDQLAQELAEQSPGRLLVKFDDKHDTLVEAARSRNLPLPDKRVSVHDVLVLLFGAACEPAQPWIRQVRAHLPSPQRYRYDQVDVSRGPWPCLVVDSTSAPPPGLGHVPSFLLPFLPVPAPSATGKAQPPAEGMTLYLARNHSIPFSFAKIEVTSPVFEATLKVRDFDSLQSPSAAAPAEATFREAVALLEAPAARSPFDRARLPKEQVGVVYYGDLALGGRPLLFRADVRSVGNESVDGVPHRWLEISVESGPQLEHKEEARVLVNETRYEQGEFTIERGLFVCQDVVLPFELSGESRELEENFHFLDKPLPSQRLGVHDVLAMLFDAKAGSLFNALRAQLSAVPGERKLTWKEINFGSQKKSVDAWELKADGGKPNAPSYSIERSPDIPFEFVNVKVNAPPFLALAVRLKPEELHRDVASKLVEASLEMRRRVTSDLLKAAKESHPNWRLWSLRDQPTPLWAEYGGSAVGTSKILLRDRYGTILQPIHRGDLTDSGDQALVERGRTWYNPSGAPLFRGELAEARGLRLTFHRTDTGRIELRSLSDFSLEDQELLKHLRELLKAVAPEKSAPPASVPRNRRSSTSTFPSTRR